MNQWSSYVAVIVLLVMVMALMVAPIEARKKEKKAKTVCKYDRKGEEGPCDTATNKKNITLPLKKGDPNICSATKIISKPCKKNIKGCKYEKKGSNWTECSAETNERSRVMKLKAGSNPECPETRTKTKSCGGRNKKKAQHKSRKDA